MANSFFKVVLFSNDQGLEIPIAFMRKYGDELKKILFLKVQNGASWQVELVNYDNRTWLKEGWQEFAEYYEIKKFYFLVFRYDGNSLFHVLIFEPSGLEIQYSFEAGTTDQTEDHVDQEDLQVNVYVEILDDDLPITRMSASKQINTRKPDKLNNISYQKAKTFRSKKPFFICFMQPSYVSHRFKLNLPLPFVKNYLGYNDDGQQNLVLRVPELHQTWQATCRTYKHRAMISTGWRKFVEENGIKMNDACVFEMESGSNIFNIIIYRATEHKQ